MVISLSDIILCRLGWNRGIDVRGKENDVRAQIYPSFSNMRIFQTG